MITKTNYITKRSASLIALDQEISRQTSCVDRNTLNVTVKCDEAIHGLQATRDNAAKLLRELHAVSYTAWAGEGPTMEIEDVWNEQREAVIAAITTTYCGSNLRQHGRHATGGPHQSSRVRRVAPRGACY